MANKILIVDDEPYFREILREFLQMKGCSVLEAGSGNEAVSLYKRSEPNVVLLDMRMPGKSGPETLRELKELDPEASVIMVSAVFDEELAKEALDEGAFDYITKPCNFDYLELVLMVRLALIGEESCMNEV